MIQGYKVFNPDWTCRDQQYKPEGRYRMLGAPELCKRGFHFCKKLSLCFLQYDFVEENKVAEVIAFGDIDTDGKIYCTNDLYIIREIPWSEVYQIVNTGSNNKGRNNAGNYNVGSFNSGNGNLGWHNTGNENIGDQNVGDRNFGNTNIGSFNNGDYNIGNHNFGTSNIGDWNSALYSNGCFNTELQKIYLFNELSEWTYYDWLNSEARKILERAHFSPVRKNDKKELYTVYTKDEMRKWWKTLRDEEKAIIKAIPNFDPVIFKQITGINTKED